MTIDSVKESTPTAVLDSFSKEAGENEQRISSNYKPSSADMKFFYERLLPFRQIFQWLNHSPKPQKDFTMREFAYEHRSGAYQRYNSFGSLEEFKKSVADTNPTRFEIGAVYSVNPKERKNLPKNALKPVGKELVFDIDLTDYDEIRTCCKETQICTKCWKFIQVATKILDAALKEDFGFKHLLWVFSGRRGAHCWVSDSRARRLDETTRKSIVEYLDILGKQPKGNRKLLNLRKPFHPHIERSFNILKQEFVNNILEEQDPWFTSTNTNDSKSWEKVEELLTFLPDKSLQDSLRSKWRDQPNISNSKSKWEDINVMAKKVLKNQIQVNQLNEAKKDVIIYYMYPRLDIEVSRQVIHLLKSPFCIHPGTGNVCVPFDPTTNISNNTEDDDYGFNPINSPNLRLLQNELEIWEAKRINRESSQASDESDGGKTQNNRILDYEKTSLKPYVDYFSKFVNNLLKDELSGIGKRDRDYSLEF